MRGAGVINGDIRQRFRAIHALNRTAGFRRLRIAARSEHDPARRVVPRRTALCRRAPPAAAARIGTSGSSISGSTTCASGSPSRTLNSMTFGPSDGEHEADVKEPAERMTLGRHSGQHRIHDLPHHPDFKGGVEQRTRRERAHSAGIRTPIVVEDPLVILRRSDRQRAGAVADKEERDFGTAQAFLDHRAARRRRRISGQPSPPRWPRSAAERVVRNHDAFPAASPSALSTTGNPKAPS